VGPSGPTSVSELEVVRKVVRYIQGKKQAAADAQASFGAARGSSEDETWLLSELSEVDDTVPAGQCQPRTIAVGRFRGICSSAEQTDAMRARCREVWQRLLAYLGKELAVLDKRAVSGGVSGTAAGGSATGSGTTKTAGSAAGSAEASGAEASGAEGARDKSGSSEEEGAKYFLLREILVIS